jgi:hypothetical protein
LWAGGTCARESFGGRRWMSFSHVLVAQCALQLVHPVTTSTATGTDTLVKETLRKM